MTLLKLLVIIVFGGRLIRFIINSINRSQKNDRGETQRNAYDSRFENQTDADEEARRRAYRMWQEEVYRRYRESQNQYQNQYSGQQQ